MTRDKNDGVLRRTHLLSPHAVAIAFSQPRGTIQIRIKWSIRFWFQPDYLNISTGSYPLTGKIQENGLSKLRMRTKDPDRSCQTNCSGDESTIDHLLPEHKAIRSDLKPLWLQKMAKTTSGLFLQNGAGFSKLATCSSRSCIWTRV